MVEVLASWGRVIVTSALALPLCTILIWWRATTVRDAGGGDRWRHSIAEVGAVAGTLPWLWMVMTPVSGPGGRVVPLVNLYAVLHDSFTPALVQS